VVCKGQAAKGQLRGCRGIAGAAGAFERVKCAMLSRRPPVPKETVFCCTLTEPLHACSGGEHRVSHWHKRAGNIESLHGKPLRAAAWRGLSFFLVHYLSLSPPPTRTNALQ
jgi:hypothetical protein